jgi:hypothetical protein
MRQAARFDRISTPRFGVTAPVAHSGAYENPHEYAIFAGP